MSKTERTRLRRMRERGHFDRETIYRILDAMPTFQWREGDHVYWHASSGGRGVKAWGKNLCA